MALAAAAAVAGQHGVREAAGPAWLFVLVQTGLVWLSLAVAGDLVWWRVGRDRWTTIVGRTGEFVVLGSIVAECVGLWFAAEAVGVCAALVMVSRLNGYLARTLRQPLLLLPGSFVVMIAVSACLLRLPAATPPDQPIGWVDAVFTATSAVCVTGLTVRDTGSGFTPFGQSVIAISIQLGGLGLMVFGSTLALLMGSRLSMRENLTLSTALDEYPAHRISRFVWFIVLTCVVVEAAGAAALYVALPSGMPDRAWMAVFHSVSAFCNAGFDLTGQSLIGMRGGAAPYLCIVPLVVVGGLGFVVLEEIGKRAAGRAAGSTGRGRLSLHTRLVVVTTALLLLGGSVVILATQLGGPDASPGQRVLDAMFMSATARTAGFTTMPMEDLTPGSRLTLMLLMLVGGSPGSMSGGMKTVVFAVLVLAVVCTVRGREDVEVFGRAVPDALVKKAATIAFGLLGLVAVTCLVLDMTESIAFEPLVFEVISAATTTGLSLGATQELSPAGRLVISATMVLGRVGPLALLGSILIGPGSRRAYRFPRERISLG